MHHLPVKSQLYPKKMKGFYCSLFLFTIISICPNTTVGHGRLMKPPNRSSVWRWPEFSQHHPIPNYTDNQLFCGGLHQEEHPGKDCGICGDPLSSPTPRDNEIGGRYYKGIITGRYFAGQTIDVVVEITAAHKGFMQWRLCTYPEDQSQACFNQHVLEIDGTGSDCTKVTVTEPRTYSVRLKLPPGVSCSHCVIQWNYRAGNNWGNCNNGTSGLGCGPQETFRGCADVSISP